MQQVSPLDRLRHSVPPLLSGLAVYGLAVDSWRGQMLRDGDTYWHIKAGEWMLAHGRVLHQDIFSYTAAGRTWVPHEWLSEIIMALVYDAGGWTGLVALSGALGGLTLYLLAAHLGRFVGSIATATLVFFAAFALLVVFLARPHLLALPLVELWTATLVIARADSRGPPWWLLPVMTLWANLHGGFILGLALTAALGVEAVLADRAQWRRIGLRWGCFLAAATLAAMITPNFPEGFLLPFRFLSMNTMFEIIGEWRSPNFQQVDPLEYSLLAMLLFGFWRGLKLPPFRLLLLVGLVYSAFQHIRNEIMVGLMGPLLLAEPLGRQLGSVPFRKTAMPVALAAMLELPVAIPVAILFTVQLALHPVTQAAAAITPNKALAHVPRRCGNCRCSTSMISAAISSSTASGPSSMGGPTCMAAIFSSSMPMPRAATARR